jgi:hypothetical protein
LPICTVVKAAEAMCEYCIRGFGYISYPHSHSVFTFSYEKYSKNVLWTRKQIVLEILTALHVLWLLGYEKVVFVMLSVWMCLCIYVRFATVWTVWRILFIFDIQELVHHRSMHDQYEHSSSKNKGPSNGSEKTKWRFSWRLHKIFSLCVTNLWRRNMNHWPYKNLRYIRLCNFITTAEIIICFYLQDTLFSTSFSIV